jgi:hypothetical protein
MLIYEGILLGLFIYQAVAFFLLGSWKEALRQEAGEVTLPYIISSVFAAAFWPFVVIWYIITRKK